jgi:hypothetical protein
MARKVLEACQKQTAPLLVYLLDVPEKHVIAFHASFSYGITIRKLLNQSKSV